MGCNQSRDKPPKDQPGSLVLSNTKFAHSVEPAGSITDIAQICNAVTLILSDGEKAILEIVTKEGEECLHGVVGSFLNSVVEICEVYYRLNQTEVAALLDEICKKNKLSLLDIGGESFVVGSDHIFDEIFCRLMRLFCSALKTDSNLVPREVFSTLHSSVLVEELPPQCSFKEILVHVLKMADRTDIITKLFNLYSNRNAVMSAECLLHYQREVQDRKNATMFAADDKIRCTFGGYLTKYNFTLYILSRTLNNAMAPSHVSNVWQDMTQPISEYLIHTELVNSVDEMAHAMDRAVRAVVLHCRKDETTGTVYAGRFPLCEMLEVIRKRAFLYSRYPLFICLGPEKLSADLQDSVAKLVLSVLGSDTLAKGIMFEGGKVNDSQFSPAALEKKVLIMATQGPLKPFVGFQVADMHRSGLGVRVTHIVEDASAGKAGICKDDWLTHINGVSICDKLELKYMLAKAKLGEEIVLRRENLDDLRITVGGTLETDASNSLRLSKLVFLKFNNNSAVEDANSPPWTVFTCSPEHLCDTGRKEQLHYHFNFTFLENSPEGTAGWACRNGIQFICPGVSLEEKVWVQGLFAENAQCGYLYKGDLVSHAVYDIDIELLMKPIRYRLMNVKSITGEMYGEGTLVTNTDANMVVIKGAGIFSVASFTVTYVDVKDERLTTTVTFGFPPRVIRPGYRLLAAYQTKDMFEKHIVNTIFTKIKVAHQAVDGDGEKKE